MSALTAVVRQGYRGTFYWRPWRSWTANMVVRPVTYLMVFGILHRQLDLGTTQGLVLALCSYVTVVTVVMCANHAISNDHQHGTFTVAMSTPVAPATVWLTRCGAHLPNGAASAVTAVAFSAVAFDLDLGRVDASVPVTFLVVLLSGLSVAMLVGILTRRLTDWVGPVALASGTLLTLSGAVIPRHDLPGPLRQLSAVVPLSHANDALRRGFGLAAGSPWPAIGAELLVALGVGAAALLLFDRSVQRARAIGTLIVEGT
ncbi:MAG: type transporter [Actinomycetia bacterium]|nr:type transporter [Actinomycetes bacterium]